MTWLDDFQAKQISDLNAAVDSYINAMCLRLDMNPEQLAEKYELEYEPIQLEYSEDMFTDEVRMRATQRFRLKRRQEQ